MEKLFFPAALFTVSFALRLSLIGKGPYHYDVAELILSARRLIGGEGLQYMHGAGYPLHVVLASLFIRVFGHAVFAVNFMAVLAGSLAVCVLYACLCRLIDRRTALFASLLFSFFPAFLSATVYGINNGIAVLFALLSLLFLLKAAPVGRTGYLLAAGISLGCCAAVRLPESLFILPLAILYFTGRPARPVLQTAWFCAAWVAVPLVFYVPMLEQGGADQLFRAMDSVTQGRFLGLWSKMLDLSGAWMREMLTRPLVVMSVIGAVFLYFQRRRVFLFLVIWFTVFFFYYGNVATAEPRMLIMAGIPALAFAGYSLSRFYQAHRLAALLLLAMTGYMMSSPLFPVLKYRHEHAQAREFFTWLERNTSPGSAVLATDNGIFLRFYTSRTPLSHPGNCDREAISRFFNREVDRRLVTGKDVYLIRSAYAYDPCSQFRVMLTQRYSLVYIGSHTNEDWHHHCLTPGLYEDVLYKIEYRRGAINGYSGSGRGAGGIDRGLGAAGDGERSAATHHSSRGN